MSGWLTHTPAPRSKADILRGSGNTTARDPDSEIQQKPVHNGLTKVSGLDDAALHAWYEHDTGNVLEGTVIGLCMQRDRNQQFIRFPNAVECQVTAGKVIYMILDNYAAHKHPSVRKWLAGHSRSVFHFRPTSCSWLNAVEGFLARLTRRRLKRGTCPSFIALQEAINRFIEHHKPPHFIWKSNPKGIIPAAKRGHQTLQAIH
jgi:DDE superfamily endonuclease